MSEHPSAGLERDRLRQGLLSPIGSPLSVHLSHGLAYTVGSALGSTPPTLDACLAAFVVPNVAGLTAGARAWSKHAHRSAHIGGTAANKGDNTPDQASIERSKGWWGTPCGPVARINERALMLFWKTMNNATWRNLHWLPHSVLVYEARVVEGYGTRWSQNRGVSTTASGSSADTTRPSLCPSDGDGSRLGDELDSRPWVFRGFLEPMMEKGHEVGWRH